MNKILHIQNTKKTSYSFSLVIRVLGKTFLVSHDQYDKAISLGLFVVTMFAPVAAVAMAVGN